MANLVGIGFHNIKIYIFYSYKRNSLHLITIILFFLILVKFSLTMRSFQGRCMYINRFLSELSLTHLYLIIIA